MATRMNEMARTALVVFTVAIALARAQPQTVSAPELVFTNVTVIDGRGGTPQPRQTIEIRAGKITAVRATTTTDHATVNVAGSFVTPGLIDSHVHFNSQDKRAVRAGLDFFLHQGITTVREMACCAPDYEALKAQPDTTLLPRVYSSAFWAGPAFMRDDPRIGAVPRAGQLPWALSVTDTTDLDAALRGAKQSGATGIKIYSDLSPDLVHKIATAAHQSGMRVWSHSTIFPTRPSEVATADIDVISHAALFVWEGVSNLPEHYDRPHPFNPFGPPAPYDTVPPTDARVTKVLETIRRRGIILDPTVATMREAVSDQAARWAIELTKVAHAMGIPLAVGTDGVSIFDELEVLVDAVGLTPLEALTSATSVGAAAIGVGGELGVVETGKAADLVVYPSNPSVDIRNLRRPFYVITRGRLVRLEK